MSYLTPISLAAEHEDRGRRLTRSWGRLLPTRTGGARRGAVAPTATLAQSGISEAALTAYREQVLVPLR